MENSKMQTENLISVIVPVYNVEDYLEECVDSILDQTFENFELLLVNDGSTDGSYNICTRYAGLDDRIVVFNKENGGLSDARNYGMKKMKGQYFTFIDSDDIIPKNYLEELVNSILENNSQIAFCDFVRMNDGVVDSGSLSINGKITQEDAAVYCFKGILAHSACAKLFKAEVSNNLEFPKDKYFEDQFAIYDTLIKYSACVTNRTKYIYRKRQGSITQNSEKMDKRNADLMESLEHVEAVIKEQKPELEYALDFKILEDCMVIIKNDIKLGRTTEITEKAVNKIKGLNEGNLVKIGTGKSFMTQYKMIKGNFGFYRLVFGTMSKLGMNREA